MRFARWILPAAVSLSVVCLLTTMLLHLKMVKCGLVHPVFIFLPLVAIIAIAWGSVPALLCVLAASACSAFFLYDPIYSFHVANKLEVGDLVCFSILATFGVKCACELLRRPNGQVQGFKSRYYRRP
jgi:K+-sensing histidine kinase KdpD